MNNEEILLEIKKLKDHIRALLLIQKYPNIEFYQNVIDFDLSQDDLLDFAHAYNSEEREKELSKLAATPPYSAFTVNELKDNYEQMQSKRANEHTLDPLIERLYNDSSDDYKIINEMADFLEAKYNEEPSFTLACFRTGLSRDESEELFMLYSDMTIDLASKDSDLINKEGLLLKTKKLFPKLTNDKKIKMLINSYINCYFLLKDKE